MSNTLVVPDNEAFPTRKRWTRDDCYRLMEKGELDDGWELIDGEILSIVGHNPPHVVALRLTMLWLLSLFGDRLQVQASIVIPGLLGYTNEPEPDFAITTGPPAAYARRLPSAEDVPLIVEVSDSSLSFDLTTKALLYARAGITEYCVVDIHGRQLHRHRTPTSAGYADVQVFIESETFSLNETPASRTRVADLLPPRDE